MFEDIDWRIMGLGLRVFWFSMYFDLFGLVYGPFAQCPELLQPDLTCFFFFVLVVVALYGKGSFWAFVAVRLLLLIHHSYYDSILFVGLRRACFDDQ